MSHKIISFASELGVKLHPGQAESLSGYFESDRPNWLLLAGRRGGKSLISDVIACFEAVVPDFSGTLRESEERYIIVVSVRQENAMLHIRNINKLLRHSKSFRKMILSVKQDRIELTNGVTILSLPASARAGRGFTASTVIFDELAHFQDTQGNSSADAVFDAYSPVVATFGDRGRLVITTTPAARTGIVYDLFDRAERGELDDFYITRKPTRELNPKVSERVISRAMNRDSLSAQVEYFAEFSDPVANYLDGERIDQAVDRHRRRVESAQSGATYVMAIDPATMGDRYAFLVAHRDDEGRVVLDYSQILRPPVNPEAAEDLLKDLVRRFKPVTIRCDTAATVQRLKDKIPSLEYTPFSRPLKLRIYGALKETLNLGNLVLYRDDDLIDELKSLQIRNGTDISAPRAGRITHDDLSDCLALCCDALVVGVPQVTVIKDPFWNQGARDVVGYPDSEVMGTEPHPPGITWRTCKKRNKGCQACVDELTAEGWFAEQDRIAELTKGQGPQDETEYYKQLLANIGLGPDRIRQDRERKTRDAELLRKFWRDATRK